MPPVIPAVLLCFVPTEGDLSTCGKEFQRNEAYRQSKATYCKSFRQGERNCQIILHCMKQQCQQGDQVTCLNWLKVWLACFVSPIPPSLVEYTKSSV